MAKLTCPSRWINVLQTDFQNNQYIEKGKGNLYVTSLQAEDPEAEVDQLSNKDTIILTSRSHLIKLLEDKHEIKKLKQEKQLQL